LTSIWRPRAGGVHPAVVSGGSSGGGMGKPGFQRQRRWGTKPRVGRPTGGPTLGAGVLSMVSTSNEVVASRRGAWRGSWADETPSGFDRRGGWGPGVGPRGRGSTPGWRAESLQDSQRNSHRVQGLRPLANIVPSLRDFCAMGENGQNPGHAWRHARANSRTRLRHVRTVTDAEDQPLPRIQVHRHGYSSPLKAWCSGDFLSSARAACFCS
jgi:hypothetical protein